MNQDDLHRADVIQALLDETERAARVYTALIPTCPVCWSEPAVTCRYVTWMEFVCLDAAQQMWAHPARIVRAIQTGAAEYADVVAQFGDQVPEWLQELDADDDTADDDTAVRL